MRNFKSFTATALTAIAALGFVALSAPAQACTNCGLKLNGLTFNGPVLQGVTLNGPVIQGISLQGVTLNGPILQGITFNGIRLNSIKFNGLATTGTRAGQYLAVTLPSGETVSLR